MSPVEPGDVVAELQQLSHPVCGGGEPFRDRTRRGGAIANDELVDEPHCRVGELHLLGAEHKPAPLDHADAHARQFGRSHHAERIEGLCGDPHSSKHERKLGALGGSGAAHGTERRRGELEPWPCALDVFDEPLLELADTLARIALERTGLGKRRRASSVPAEAARDRALLLRVEPCAPQQVAELAFEGHAARRGSARNAAA